MASLELQFGYQAKNIQLRLKMYIQWRPKCSTKGLNQLEKIKHNTIYSEN